MTLAPEVIARPERLGLLKWPMTKEEALKINLEELSWLLKGYEVRTTSKFKPIEEKNYYQDNRKTF